MKKIIMTLLITILLVAFPLMADDTEEKEKQKVDVSIGVGAVAAGNDGNLTKVKEYDPIDEGVRPVVKGWLEGYLDKIYFFVSSDFRGHEANQHHEAGLDINRVLKQTLSFDGLHHRLDNDPLTNIDVVSEARSGAYVENFNPNDNYYLNRYEILSQTAITLPGIPFFTLYVNYRDIHRTGQYQARTLSKCSACHVIAKSRSINNHTRDLQFGGKVRLGKSILDYSYATNKYKESEAAPTNDYLLVQHPEKIIPVFNSRISYGNNETLPFDVIPESNKETHLVQANIPVSEASTVSAHFVSSNVENITSDLNWKSNNFAGAFTTRLGKRGFLNARFQYLDIENTSIFIDIAEPVDVAGPNNGQTYAGAYGEGTFDWTRDSALTRKVMDLDFNFRYKLGKGLRLRLGYEYKNTDREHYAVQKTTSNTFKGQLAWKPVRQVKFTLDGKYRSMSNPFANINGGIAPPVQYEAYDNPFAGTQFFEWHAMRTADLTNFPKTSAEGKLRINWNPSAKFGAFASAQYRNDENNDLDYSGISWSRTTSQYGIDLWLLLGKKFPITATYYNYKSTYSSVFAIAVLEGCGAGIVGGMTGTLTDMMDYDLTTNTVLVNFNYMASKKLNMHLNFNYNDSVAEISDLQLDTSQVDYLPGSAKTALNYDDFGGISNYSKLDIKQTIAEFGFDYFLSKCWTLNGAIFYYLYDDLAEYLYTDTTGKSYSFFLGVTWQN